MNKKGFTLIEIIICISMLVVIGVGSFIGIRMVNKNLTIKGLKQITNNVVEAAQVYIETNKEAYNQLYSNQNGVSLPLQLLVNEGLLSLKGTNLNENNIENQYVVTFLSGGGQDNCEQIKTITSWSNDQPVYLCMKSDGSSNLAFIDPTKYNNKTYVSNEPYYFKGYAPNNYVKFVNSNIKCAYINEDDRYTYSIYNNTKYRILYIDVNDDIVILINKDYNYCKNGDEFLSTYLTDNEDIIHSFSPPEKEYGSSWLGSNNGDKNKATIDLGWQRNLRLPSSCKIKSGAGLRYNPFQVEC